MCASRLGDAYDCSMTHTSAVRGAARARVSHRVFSRLQHSTHRQDAPAHVRPCDGHVVITSIDPSIDDELLSRTVLLSAVLSRTVLLFAVLSRTVLLSAFPGRTALRRGGHLRRRLAKTLREHL